MNTTIRDARKEDMPAVLELIKELAAFEKEPDAVITTVETLEKEGFGAQPLFHVFVAEVDGKIEGMALVYYRFSTWKGRTLHLEDLIVREEKRGTGLGNALYRKVIEYARSQDLKRVEWVVLDWNKHAIDFYERSGATILKDWYTVQMDEDGMTQYVKSAK
ncbi:GNAT family N-acetyltransferase [Salinimicrobium oceani]|uniref:GNAT family N-acetyltransferase n=1 Tax=Salinimicrobium oceani TaxID=2722702 RepID=A0ABX1CVD1_9FLAO|nr:GNAT family N-acetyltransferase [Salinimicrobium oceani]NJW52227.1 GNAT family N-acetyltransferase [Salinimicrobium oceani]